MKAISLFPLFLTCRLAEGFQPSPLVSSRFTITTGSETALNLFSFGKKEEVEEAIVPEKATVKNSFSNFLQKSPTTKPVASAVFAVEAESSSWTDFGSTPVTYAYFSAWAALCVFAFFLAPGELGSASDTAMINSIIADPAHPDMNPFYYGIFNLFAIIPVVLAATIAPRASDKGIPAGPPLFLSAFIAYFVMGPYLAFRKTPKEVIVDPAAELGWATKNIWENKLVNYGTVAFGLLCLASGTPGLEDPAASWQGMLDLIGSSRFASVSLADLSLITLILIKEVADDYKIRCEPGQEDNATLIGASTALLPIFGAAIYCAVRPPLIVEEED